MSPRQMPQHNFRCTNEDWEKAKAVAEELNEVLSEEIRIFVKQYGQKLDKVAPPDEV